MSPRRSSALTLEHVLLALLDRQPMHGYELYQELSELKGISLVWNIKQPMLYALLDKLEARGFLSSQVVQGGAHPPRKYFHLTPAGQNSLQAWIRTPVRRARDLRQEFLAKLVVARRYGKSNALELIHIQQQTCRAWSADLQANAPTLAAESVDEWLVYSFRMNRVAAVLDWLQVCERELDHLEELAAGDRPPEGSRRS